MRGGVYILSVLCTLKILYRACCRRPHCDAYTFVLWLQSTNLLPPQGALVWHENRLNAGLVGWCWAPRSASDTIFRCQNFQLQIGPGPFPVQTIRIAVLVFESRS